MRRLNSYNRILLVIDSVVTELSIVSVENETVAYTGSYLTGFSGTLIECSWCVHAHKTRTGHKGHRKNRENKYQKTSITKNIHVRK